ncbi:MAG: SdrD B-like domain-containing protein [Corynebacterium sp.]|uniref:SdrD B-like domain-containing protein n=1 Tax=Corynebacterium sp. TaxID=1720 RepID=UPI0026DF2F23|nr:SdrD B-like domain-containing protein [Corynebacterium sp.]MDO5668470.1 SdrD B-like domain-containing protein [Corynebacterium sp.]
MLDSDLETGIGSLTGFTVTATPNEYGSAAAQVQHWDPKTGISYWRIPFGTAEVLQNVRMEIDLPEGYEVSAMRQNNVVVYLDAGKFGEYGIADARPNAGYVRGTSSPRSNSPESKEFRQQWTLESQSDELLVLTIDEMPARSHAVLRAELMVEPGFEVDPVSQVDLRITADRACGISGNVFNDVNGNGVWDAGELPRPGVPVYLFNSAGEIVDDAVTNNRGQYRFGELGQDDYVVQFARPEGVPGYIFTQGVDSQVNTDGATEPLVFDLDTPQYGPDREFRSVIAGVAAANLVRSASYDDSYTSPGVSVEVNQTGAPFIPAGSQYAVDEAIIPEGWDVEIDPDSGRLTVTPPLAAQPGENHVIGVIISLADDAGTVETTARVEVDAQIVGFEIDTETGELIVFWNYYDVDGNPVEEVIGVVVGEDCVDDTDGQDGTDGVGIESVDILNGELMISLTNGEVHNAGPVIGEDGQDGADGVGIESIEIINGELVITITNGETQNAGPVAGQDGAPGRVGEDGEDGQDGVDIESVEVINGELIVTFTNGDTENVGRVVGEDGQDGASGRDGVDSRDGRDGSVGGGSVVGLPGSSNGRCVQAVATVGIPLLALLPFGLARQVNIPGLSPLVADAQAQLMTANTELQQQSGIYDGNTANFMAQVNAELQKHGATVGQLAGGAALLAVGGLVATYIYDNCV